MSWEAWGDDDAGDVDYLIDQGWLSPEEAQFMLEDLQHANRLVLGLFLVLLAVAAASFL